MLSNKQLKDVCLLGQGHKGCRYLVYNNKRNNYMCCKLVQAMKDAADKQVSEFKKHAKANGQDLAALHRPVGDNCKGYIWLQFKRQGYDQKS